MREKQLVASAAASTAAAAEAALRSDDKPAVAPTVAEAGGAQQQQQHERQQQQQQQGLGAQTAEATATSLTEELEVAETQGKSEAAVIEVERGEKRKRREEGVEGRGSRGKEKDTKEEEEEKDQKEEEEEEEGEAYTHAMASSCGGKHGGRGSGRKIAIAVDLSDESAHAVKWAVKNYLRRDDDVVLVHVRPTSVLYGADWGASDAAAAAAGADKETRMRMESEFDSLTLAKTAELAQPLDGAGISYRTHIVKDHDMKERICLEVERLNVSACIMGSRGLGAQKKSRKARLGSVSDYCVHHCDCPVVVVRMSDGDEHADAKHQHHAEQT